MGGRGGTNCYLSACFDLCCFSSPSTTIGSGALAQPLELRLQCGGPPLEPWLQRGAPPLSQSGGSPTLPAPRHISLLSVCLSAACAARLARIACGGMSCMRGVCGGCVACVEGVRWVACSGDGWGMCSSPNPTRPSLPACPAPHPLSSSTDRRWCACEPPATANQSICVCLRPAVCRSICMSVSG